MVFKRTGPLVFSGWLLLYVSLKERYDSGVPVELMDIAAKPFVAVSGVGPRLLPLLLRLLVGAGDGARFMVGGCIAACCCCIIDCWSRVSEVRRELSVDVGGVDCAEMTLR